MLSVAQAGDIKVAEDVDFQKLKSLCDEAADWKLEYQKNQTTVWTKNNDVSTFKMIKVCILFDFLYQFRSRIGWRRRSVGFFQTSGS